MDTVSRYSRNGISTKCCATGCTATGFESAVF
ncbi:hypothetical protein DWW36_01585 [Erysipelotrichaceae bacterium AF15-26LB]|nr:hypothetical protein GKZ87_04315 [Erysipelotrichaceae bacterium 66202529]RJV92469.1 hypothetical protein DWW36_01585 [Erysipelotrichaceae bacterium AF15-26LB]RJV92818.1 hypothetical protein DWX45_01830 [Erysipelotrichaceae bacterium AF19-24AC]